MKKILICLTACLGLFVATSCEDKEWTDSKVTYYATLTLEGDDFMILTMLLKVSMLPILPASAITVRALSPLMASHSRSSLSASQMAPIL